MGLIGEYFTISIVGTRYKIWVKEEDLQWMEGRRNNNEGGLVKGDSSYVAFGEAVRIDVGSHNFFGDSLDGDRSGMALLLKQKYF